MNRYITRGIANSLPIILQKQLWQLVARREQTQSKGKESLDYFHIFQFNMHNNHVLSDQMKSTPSTPSRRRS